MKSSGVDISYKLYIFLHVVGYFPDYIKINIYIYIF